MTRPSCGAFASKALCFWGRPTPTSSRWARRMKFRVQTGENPWSTDRVPGGSSGGPAAAVAASLAAVSLGSDTGGSIRQPAGFCGVVGLKPTYGRVSRLGLMAFASSLDQIGPFAWTVEDAAMTLQAIAGHDPQDSTSSREAVPDYRSALSGDISGMKIGVADEYTVEGMEPGVADAVDQPSSA